MTLKGDALGDKARPIRDAATVIVLRETQDRENQNGIETFMVCRNKKSPFLGGVHVFPGGKLDDGDMSDTLLARILSITPAEMANKLGEEIDDTHAAGLWITAIRETFEEAGVLLGEATKAIDLKSARDRLNDRQSFAPIAEELGLKIHGEHLQPYARWITPPIEKRRFDTRFFLAAVPEGQEASYDGKETTSARWLSPDAALSAMLNGDIKLAPPTLCTLQWLSGFNTIDTAFASAAARPPPLVNPHVVSLESGWMLTLPGDQEHPTSKRALDGDGPTRLKYVDGKWFEAT